MILLDQKNLNGNVTIVWLCGVGTQENPLVSILMAKVGDLDLCSKIRLIIPSALVTSILLKMGGGKLAMCNFWVISCLVMFGYLRMIMSKKDITKSRMVGKKNMRRK